MYHLGILIIIICFLLPAFGWLFFCRWKNIERFWLIRGLVAAIILTAALTGIPYPDFFGLGFIVVALILASIIIRLIFIWKNVIWRFMMSSLVILLLLLPYPYSSYFMRQAFLDEPLIDAAWKGNVVKAHLLLRLGANPNADYFMCDEKIYCEEPPLCAAVENNHFEMVELLLKYGADPDYREPETDRIAFWLAKGNKGMTSILLQAVREKHKAEIDRFSHK